METIQKIFKDYQIRNTKSQKINFIKYLKSRYPELKVEEGGILHNRNLVLGDVKSSKLILTAHYDTPCKMIVPNFITPLNPLIYYLYQLLLCVVICGIMLFTEVKVVDKLLSAGAGLILVTIIDYLACIAVMAIFLLCGPNKNTANDNTSGVITLCNIWESLTEEEKSKVCLVFFDNEEWGLLGSGYFKSIHKNDGIQDKLLLNFDCVGDGSAIMLGIKEEYHDHYHDILKEAFDPSFEELLIPRKFIYPSDQLYFKRGVGIASLNHNKVLGYYMDKIHTSKDVVCDIRNIEKIGESVKRLIHILE